MRDPWKILACTFALTTAGASWALVKKAPSKPAIVVRRTVAAPRIITAAVKDDVDALLRKIDGTDNAVEIAGLCSKLGAAGDERAVPTLAKYADDSHPAVAAAAIAALGKIGGDDATELLISLSANGRMRLREAAV